MSKGGGDPSIRSEDRGHVFMGLRPLQKDLSSAAVTNLEWSPTDAPYAGTEGESSTIATTAPGKGAGAAQDRVAKGTIGKGKG